MSENTKKTQITIGEQTYFYEQLTEEQRFLFDNCLDLDRKIGSSKFSLNQLMVGKEAFYSMLKSSLEVKMTDIKQELTE